jgi:hypothetical protein
MSGQAGGRGYLVQAVISVLSALTNDHDWTEIELEPNITSDKVDILWQYSNRRRAVQVKSSQNQINVPDVKRWAEELEGSIAADEYELSLIGPVSQGVIELGSHSKVAIPTARNLDLEGLVHQAAHQLDRYLQTRELGAKPPSTREMIVHALVSRLSAFATKGKPVGRDDFDELLRSWISEIPDVGTDLEIGSCLLPPSLPDFVGRSNDIKQIVDRLRNSGGKRSMSSHVRGMGGVGKTVTAIRACWEAKEAFPDGQVFVDLRGMTEQPLTTTDSMLEVMRAVDPKIKNLPTKQQVLLPHYRRLLSRKRLLILLDNAKDEMQVRTLLSVSSSVAFVITSRDALTLTGVESFSLDVLPTEESLLLLRGIVSQKGTDGELRTVTELCGHLPLALRVSGDFLRLHENWTLARYITHLQDEATRLVRLKSKMTDSNVGMILAFSARSLVQENELLAARWQMLSVFPTDFDLCATAAVWGCFKAVEMNEKDLSEDTLPDITAYLNTDDALEGLTELLERSLVQYNRQSHRYSLHDLMRPVAKTVFESVFDHPLNSGSKKRLEEAAGRHAEYYAFMLGVSSRTGYDLIIKVWVSDLIDRMNAQGITPNQALLTYSHSTLSKALQSTANNEPGASELDKLRHVLLEIKNILSIVGWISAEVKAGRSPNEVLLFAGVGLIDLFRRVVDFAESKESTLKGDVLKKWQEIKEGMGMGKICWFVAQLEGRVQNWETALKYGARARSLFAIHNNAELQQVDSQMAEWRAKLAPPV